MTAGMSPIGNALRICKGGFIVSKSLLEGNIAREIQSEGVVIGDKLIYGKADVTVHDDGTADVYIESNGRTFKCVIQLYVDKHWKVISEQ